MKHPYTLGIEFSKCDKDTERLCLYKRQFNKCESAIRRCHYPLLINPLCTCDCIEQCQHKFDIINHKEKIYILYWCGKCKFAISDIKESIEKILKPLNSDKIYYGKDLDKLCNKIIKKDDKKDKSDIELTVEFFEKTIKSMNRRI